MKRPPRLHEDPGLQPERTSLAWQRTGYSMLGLSALMARSLPQVGNMVFVLLAIVLCYILSNAWKNKQQYQDSCNSLNANRHPAPTMKIYLTSLAIVMIGSVYLYANSSLVGA